MGDPAHAAHPDLDVLEKLRQIAQDELEMTHDQVNAINLGSDLMEAMHLDSLATVVLVSSVEREFGLVFPPEEWQGLATVEDLVNLIRSGSEQQRAAG